MELAFREPIRNTQGDIRFPAGVFYEWPLATFKQIAKNLNKSLEEITVTKEEAGQIFVASTVISKKVAPTKRRVRTHLSACHYKKE